MPRPKNMSSSRKAAKLRRWQATLLRGGAQPLGTVEAPDEKAAIAAAAGQFGLNEEQRKRIAVHVEDDPE
jgi:hypothetical protein